MNNLVASVVATLAHDYASAVDQVKSLEDKPYMAARRAIEAHKAYITANTIVLLTDDGDWRSRARLAKAEADKALSNAGVLVSKAVKAGAVGPAFRLGAEAPAFPEIRTLTIPPEEIQRQADAGRLGSS